MAAPGEFTAGDVLAAADMNDLPGGVLGYAEVTSGQSGITTITDLTGLSVTVTVPASRRIRVTGSSQIGSAASGTELIGVAGYIRESSTTLATFGRWADDFSATRTAAVQGSVILTPSSGSHTYKLSLARTTGSGTVLIIAAADNPSFILVEDLGPSA